MNAVRRSGLKQLAIAGAAAIVYGYVAMQLPIMRGRYSAMDGAFPAHSRWPLSCKSYPQCHSPSCRASGMLSKVGSEASSGRSSS